MAEDRYLLLKVTECNWGLIGPGDWAHTEWRIYSDGFYTTSIAYNPMVDYLGFYDAPEDETTEPSEEIIELSPDKMESDAFAKLLELLATDPWTDPSQEDEYICDGTGWVFEMYREDGSIEKTSGNARYIEGHEILEEIADALPKYDSFYRLGRICTI